MKHLVFILIKSDKYIVIGSSATLSQEFRYVDANKPDNEFEIFQKVG